MPSLSRSKSDFLDPQRGPIFSPRFVVAVLLVVLGIAWMAYYYIVVRVDPTAFPAPKPGKPGFMADLENWNYLIGFGLIFVGLFVAAHPSTPLGRGRGVVVTMLTCFILGLLWICTYYVFTGNEPRQDPGLQRPRPVQPARRHRLHGRRLLLRHALGVNSSTAGDEPGENYIDVVLPRRCPQWG